MSDTPVSGIRRSSSAPKESPEQRARKRRIQMTAGVVLIALLIAIGYYVQSVNGKGAFIWAIGLGFGYVLQRSRFCFTASLRDPVLTGGTALTKAVIIALALGSLGYAALQMKEGTSVLLLCKKELTLSNSSLAQGGVVRVGVDRQR